LYDNQDRHPDYDFYYFDSRSAPSPSQRLASFVSHSGAMESFLTVASRYAVVTLRTYRKCSSHASGDNCPELVQLRCRRRRDGLCANQCQCHYHCHCRHLRRVDTHPDYVQHWSRASLYQTKEHVVQCIGKADISDVPAFDFRQ
jgi:hypothetical protein